jgi:hypothetical protein
MKKCRKCGAILLGEFNPKFIKITCLGNQHQIENIGKEKIKFLTPIELLTSIIK